MDDEALDAMANEERADLVIEGQVDELRDLREEIKDLKLRIEDKDLALKDLEEKADLLVSTLQSVIVDVSEISTNAREARR